MAARRTPGREDILDAAESLMSGKGFDSTSIADICRESGLPVGSVYWHFGSKAGLLAAVMERGAERFFASLPHSETFEGTPDERFRQWFDANTRLVAQRPEFLRLHLSLCLIDTESSARDISHRVRGIALDRLSASIAPWLEAKGIADAAARGRELADCMLSLVDGAFIAEQLGVSYIDALTATFYSCLLARAQELAAS